VDKKTDQTKISIIMPVLNEASTLRSTLSPLTLSEREELIIVDGGSTDDSLSIAREFTDKVFHILLFLHADCMLPDNGFDAVRQAVRDRSIAAGAFFLNIAHRGLSYRIIEQAANIRSRATSLLYGDQGMFLRKDIFDRIGGFPDIPLMEDIEISGRLKKEGKLIFINPPIQASPRRWLSEGIIYTTLRDWTIAFLYTFLKVSPEKLITYYKNIR
jgi:glycosyltransferase involved in cell wall biosynthesis